MSEAALPRFDGITTESFSTCSHLKSPDSTIGLIEADTKCEHGVASTTCLLAGFRIFDTAYDSNDRNLRILRGIHGFHIYATEYWLEDLLCSNAAFGSSETAALLCSTAKALADRLSAVSHPAGTSAEQELRTLDDRLSNFADQGAVYDMLRYALMERSAKTNSDQVKHESCKCPSKGQRFIINLTILRQQFLLITQDSRLRISRTC